MASRTKPRTPTKKVTKTKKQEKKEESVGKTFSIKTEGYVFFRLSI